LPSRCRRSSCRRTGRDFRAPALDSKEAVLSDADIQTALRSMLSPEGQDLLAEFERRLEQDDTPEEELFGDLWSRFDLLSSPDKDVLARFIGVTGQGYVAELREAETHHAETERILSAMRRAAQLEGVDPRTLTVNEAVTILERHGEAF
jgi:hypothetical protein